MSETVTISKQRLEQLEAHESWYAQGRGQCFHGQTYVTPDGETKVSVRGCCRTEAVMIVPSPRLEFEEKTHGGPGVAKALAQAELVARMFGLFHPKAVKEKPKKSPLVLSGGA